MKMSLSISFQSLQSCISCLWPHLPSSHSCSYDSKFTIHQNLTWPYSILAYPLCISASVLFGHLPWNLDFLRRCFFYKNLGQPNKTDSFRHVVFRILFTYAGSVRCNYVYNGACFFRFGRMARERCTVIGEVGLRRMEQIHGSTNVFFAVFSSTRNFFFQRDNACLHLSCCALRNRRVGLIGIPGGAPCFLQQQQRDTWVR